MPMPRQFRESVRRVRLLAVLAAGFGAACSDGAGITDPTAPAVDAAPAASASVTAALLPTEATLMATASGRIVSGGTTTAYKLWSGPGTHFDQRGTIPAGTAVTIVCTATGPSTRNSIKGDTTTVWNRLSIGTVNTWISNANVIRDPGAPTPPRCDSSTGPKIAAGARGNDYPYINDPSRYPVTCGSAIYDPWHFCKRSCASFVAWRLNDVNKVGFRYSYGKTAWGSAKSWASAARKLGYRVDKVPEVGAVAQWNYHSNMPSGHVAWVSAVSSDGQRVTLEEYNWGFKGTYGTRTISTSSVDNFIHLY